MILKASCRSCGDPVVVDVSSALRPKCECGLTAEVRAMRVILFSVVVALLVAFAGCWVSNHYTTKQIQALPGAFEVKPNPGLINKFDVVPKAAPGAK